MKYHFLINLLIAGTLSLLSCNTQKKLQSGTPKNKNDFHIFILMGQSNMSGYGFLEKDDTLPVPHVFMIPTVNKGPLQWVPAAHPLHNRLPSDRFGLGLPFAKEYQKHHKGISVGLLPLAYGGAEIDKLKKGSKVYDDFLQKLAYAQNYGVIKGLLWHQGESDTVDEEKANTYESKLLQLIKDLRADVGNAELPVVVATLLSFMEPTKTITSPTE